MKPSFLVVVTLLAGAFAACQRQTAPERTAATSPTPSPVTTSAAPSSSTPGDTVSPEAPPVAAPGVPASSSRPAQTAQGTRSDRRPPATRPGRAADEAGPSAASSAANEEAPRQSAPEGTTTVRRADEPVVLAAETKLPIRLKQTLASDRSRPEEDVSAELAEDVRANGRVILPAGSEVRGHVVVAQESGRVKGRARLVVAFDEIRTRGRGYAIEAQRWDVTAESSRDRDAKIAGGAAAVGAIIGAITGGGKGALKGGLIGGAAGGAAVLVTRGKEVELRSGVVHTITLRKALRLE